MNQKISSSSRETLAFFILSIASIISFISLLAINIDSQMTIGVLLFGIAIAITALAPQVGLYVMAFFIPVVGWEIAVGKLDFQFIDFISLIVLIGFYIRVIYLYLFSKSKQSILKFPVFLPFIFFFISTIVSSFLSPTILDSAWYAFRGIIFFYLVYVSMPYSVVTSFDILKKAIIFLGLAGVITAGLGLSTLFYQYINNDFFRVQGIMLFNIYPLGFNHNLLAEYFLVVNFFVLALIYWTKSLSLRRILYIIFIFISLAGIMTLARTAWIVFAIQIGIFLYIRKTNTVKTLITLFIGVVLLTPLILKMDKLQDRNYSSTDSRLLLTEIAWKSFLEKPVFGAGTGRFLYEVDNNIRYRAKYGEAQDSHGVWQKILLENGLFGVITFATIIVIIFRLIFKAVKKYPAYQDLLLPLAIGSLGGFLYQVFNTSYYKGKVWLPIALTLTCVKLIELKEKHESEKN
ncbi:MAG TPA: O-antigen ligase family protein [bacterium]|nr:O-antigen ligase family protein [bacterium]